MAMVSRSSEPDDRDAWFAAAGIPAPPRGEDLPYDGGPPLESERHWLTMHLLVQTLREGWSARRDFYVAGNMALYFSALQARNQDFRAPDVFVVLGVEPKERKSWVVWEEDSRVPDVVIELLSDSTREVDLGEKKRVYERLRVGAYYVFDPWSLELAGWEYDHDLERFVALEKDEQGRLYCKKLGLYLGVVETTLMQRTLPFLRWLSPDGAPIPTAAEAEAERAEVQTKRAEVEANRAEAEARRADQEAERAREMAGVVAEYERRFGRLPK